MTKISYKWLCAGLFFLSINLFSQAGFESSHLPIIVITTQAQTIPDDIKINVDMGIIDNGPGQINNVNDPYNDYDGIVGIELRGSSSQSFPKKQYGIETRDQLGADIDVSLLGLPAEEDWVLYAPYSDKSLIRNVLTFQLGNDMGRYASRTRFCELVIDDDYKGVYVLMEKIKRNINRVDIAKLNEDEISGDDVSGGYIVKIDKFTGGGGEGWTSPFPHQGGSEPSVFFQYEYPKPENIVGEQQAYIENYITSFEGALKGPDFLEPVLGYSQWIDVDSFVDFLLINELTKNIDGYRLSTFLYKDKDSNGGKLTMGPIWDFNLAWGNADYCEGSTTDGWELNFNKVCPGDFWQNPFWWDRLLQDPGFVEKLTTRWTALRASTFSDAALLQLVDDLTAELGAAVDRNFERWPVLGTYVWPNNFVGNSYEEEIDYLKGWIVDRSTWMDSNLPSIGRVITSTEPPDYTNLFDLYPIPVQGRLYFISSSAKPIDISIWDMRGKHLKDIRQDPVRGPVVLPGPWDQSDLPGLYLLHIRIDDQLFVKKIIKL